MEKLIKSAFGQWKIVTESLSSKKTINITSLLKTNNIVDLDKNHNEKITKLFGNLNNHLQNNNEDEASKAKGELKSFLLTAPKGSIDIGHFSDLREEHANTYIKKNRKNKIGKNDFEDIVNHHIGKHIKSMKKIHDKYGIGGVKAMMHLMGGNGTPLQYANTNLHPRLHSETLALVNPNKDEISRKESRHLGVLPFSPWHKTPDEHIHKKHQDKIDKTYSNTLSDDLPKGHPNAGAMHEDAIIDRGLDIFKNHYKIK